jgi:hypothetical protein
MDLKALGAVFASLAAIFAGMNGGVFTEADVRGLQSTAGFQSPKITSFTSEIPVINEFLEKPEPKNQIKAQIKLEKGSKIKLNNAGINTSELRKINTEKLKASSDEEMQLKKFTGILKFGNNTQIKGKAKGIKSSGVNITTTLNLDTQLKTNQINVEETQKTNMKFSKADIKPWKNSGFPIDTQNTRVNAKSFTGDIKINTQARTLKLEGKVHKVNAGKTQYGPE